MMEVIEEPNGTGPRVQEWGGGAAAGEGPREPRQGFPSGFPSADLVGALVYEGGEEGEGEGERREWWRAPAPYGLERFERRKWRVERQSGEVSLTARSTVVFRVEALGPVLEGLWLSLALPDAWSPVVAPGAETGGRWAPYEFRWAEHVGAALLEEAELVCGGVRVGGVAGGAWVVAEAALRGGAGRAARVSALLGHEAALHDPAAAWGAYPHSFRASAAAAEPEPAVRGRRVVVPLPLFFEPHGLPLCCLGGAELLLRVTLRPLQAWFRVRDPADPAFDFPLVAPDFSQPRFAPARFFRPPPGPAPALADYGPSVGAASQLWDADVCLLADYVFLEARAVARLRAFPPLLLVRDVARERFSGLAGAAVCRLQTRAPLHALLLLPQRSDAALRNDWTNFTNWPYGARPLPPAPPDPADPALALPAALAAALGTPSLALQPGGAPSGLGAAPARADALAPRDPLLALGLRLSGAERQSPLSAHAFAADLLRLPGGAPLLPPGALLYCFAHDYGDPNSGHLALGPDRRLELLLTTLTPPLDPDALAAASARACADGSAAANLFSPFLYTFDLTVLLERVNLLSFQDHRLAPLLHF